MGANVAGGTPRPSTSFENHRSWELIGARVAVCIEASGLTGRALTEATGLTPSAIQNVKNGTQVPIMAVVRIARALGLTPNDLIPESVR